MKLKELKDLHEKSTKVVSWYPYSYPHTVRGPYGRWFTISGEDNSNIAKMEDDIKYCSASMNNLPKLINKIETLFDCIKHGDEEHQNWLKKAIDDHFNKED